MPVASRMKMPQICPHEVLQHMLKCICTRGTASVKFNPQQKQEFASSRPQHARVEPRAGVMKVCAYRACGPTDATSIECHGAVYPRRHSETASAHAQIEPWCNSLLLCFRARLTWLAGLRVAEMAPPCFRPEILFQFSPLPSFLLQPGFFILQLIFLCHYDY